MRPRASRSGCLPVLCVALVMVAVVMGGYVIAGDLDTPRLVVGRGISIRLAPGWEFVSRPGDGQEGVRVTSGTGNLDVALVPFVGQPEDLAMQYVDEVLRPGAGRLVVSKQVQRPRLRAGLEVARVSYTGAFGERPVSFEGTVTAVVLRERLGVVFDAWSDQGQYGSIEKDISAMIKSVEWR